MSHIITFDFPWVTEPFVQQNFNVYDLIDEKIEKLKCVFPTCRVLTKQEQPREWLHGQNRYLNCVRVTVELGEPDTDYLNKEFK